MLLTRYIKFLAALVTALIASSTAAAPLAVAARSTSEAPPPFQTALIPRAIRPRRLRRYLSVRYVAVWLFGRRFEAPGATGFHRPGVARRRPNREAYPRGPPCRLSVKPQHPTGRPMCRPVGMRQSDRSA